MSSIRTMCPSCISPIDLDPRQVLLLPAPVDGGSYAFTCARCEHVIVAAVTEAEITQLVTAGVQIEAARPSRGHVGPARRAAPITLDDLIEFHLLLATGDWFAQLIQRR